MDRLLPNGKYPGENDNGMTKSKFSLEEDAHLLRLVKNNDSKINWKYISMKMKTRSPRQCRERYKNYLNPSLQHDEWTLEEDKLLIKLFYQLGNKWNLISKQVKGRSGNAIRNRIHYLIKAGEISTDKTIKGKEVASRSEEVVAVACDVQSETQLPAMESPPPNLGNDIFDKIFDAAKLHDIFSMMHDDCFYFSPFL